jgi:hypothetical protein
MVLWKRVAMLKAVARIKCFMATATMETAVARVLGDL